MTWRNKTISLHTGDSVREVQALVRKGLAIIGMHDEKDDVEFFSVTHVGSGRRLGALFCGEDRASAIVDKIVALQDWSRVKSSADVLPETRNALQRLSLEHHFYMKPFREAAPVAQNAVPPT